MADVERTYATYEITGPCKHCGVRVKRARFSMASGPGDEYGATMYAGPPVDDAPQCITRGKRQHHELDVIDFNDPASVEAWLRA